MAATLGDETLDVKSFSLSPSASSIILDTDIRDLDERDDFKGVTIGVCAMSCKSSSQPMHKILCRIAANDVVRVVLFTEDTIINKPIQYWPPCDAFIAFYSKGYPLDKVINYVELKRPKVIINDLEMQYSLLDRRKVYKILEENGIDVPAHVVLERSSPNDHPVTELDDTIEFKGHVLNKPFVEKPISGEDHSIYMYFPSDYGGGSQRLFRKVRDRSSYYSKESNIRKEGSFIYEEFLATDGSDVKVYTVGPDYAHAEARKSPALDGRVDRDDHGKEKRYPVILTAKEKLIARTVSLAFKQTVCGFDMLRANGKSYVCDVNGFSFVKSSEKYYDDCAQILLEMILSTVAPQYIPSVAPSVEYLAPQVPVPIPRATTQSMMELRCVIAVIRHGDRTPKQKMKMIVKHQEFFNLFEELGGYVKGTLKIKKPTDLQKVLDIARKLLEKESDGDYEFHKMLQLKNVLEMYGHFSGINRKVQFRLVDRSIDGTVFSKPVLLLILKWGGELTPAGEVHAEELGKAFRCMYPGGEGEYSSLPGSGFLRLHSTYRHDLKVYASDEGRVQLTAAAFTKGLLDLEGGIASILVHLVKRDQNATNMLDTSTDATVALQKVKRKLHKYMQSAEDFTKDDVQQLAPTQSPSLLSAMQCVNNPHDACEVLHKKVCDLVEDLQTIAERNPDASLYQGESLRMMIGRWSKLRKDFKLKNETFDISKIPDIYDCIKYDLQHNSTLGLKEGLPLYKSAMYLADIVIPQEYGISTYEKLDISKKICTSLLRKIKADFRHTFSDSDFLHRLDPEKSHGVVSPKRSVRTRLYFTSESHIHSLVNVLKYGSLMKEVVTGNAIKLNDEKFQSYPEWNYLTQVVFMVFEDYSRPPDERYIVQVHISPGVKSRDMLLMRGENKLFRHSSDDLTELPVTIKPHSTRLRRRSGPVISTSINIHNKPKRKLYEYELTSSSYSSYPPSGRCQSSTDGPTSYIPQSDDTPVETCNILYSSSDINIQQKAEILDDRTSCSDSEITSDSSTDKLPLIKREDHHSLVSIVEPLIHLCSVPLNNMETFLNQLCDDEISPLNMSLEKNV